MKKTIREWLSELPERARMQAIENAMASVPSCGGIDKPFNGAIASLPEALCAAFIWSDSPEGREYWQTVYESLP